MPRKKASAEPNLVEIEMPELAEEPTEDLIVIEFVGDDEEALYEQLDEAREKLAKNGQIYITVPKDAIPWEQVTEFIRLNFKAQQTLNVGTNPKLQSNDFRRRAGWICLK